MSGVEVAGLTIGGVGLAVAVVGFGFTLFQIRRTRSAAESARDASDSARASVRQTISIGDVTQASGLINELMELHRTGEWPRAIDRYGPLKRLLIEGRSRYPDLDTTHHEIFRKAISQVSLMEIGVREATSGEGQPDRKGLDRTLIKIQEGLDQVRVDLEQLPTEGN